MSAGSSVLAVLGTLAAVLITSRVTLLLQRENRAQTRRTEALNALGALGKAVADHRRAMWVRESTRLRVLRQHATDGTDTAVDFDVDEHPRVQAATEASHATRSEVTTPLMLVQVLLPQLADLAETAVQATFDMHEAPSTAELIEQREQAKATAKQLAVAAATVFAESRPGLLHRILRRNRTAPTCTERTRSR